MGDTSYVDSAAAHVLANNEIMMSTPSNAKLSAFYPTPAESTNTIAQAVCNSGQLFVRANSKTFASKSDFQVSTANILDAPILSMEIVIPALDLATNSARADAYVGSWQAGWGYDLIESVEVSYSNSNISNLRIDGQALRDWSLLQCKNKDERLDLLNAAGKLQFGDRGVANTFRASIPLSFLNWQGAGGVDGGFPIDCRTLNGSIQFQISFRPLTAAIGPLASNYLPANIAGDAGTVAGGKFRPGTIDNMPVGFNNLELTFRTYQLMDSAFSVSHALQANPGMVYSLPSKWVNTYNYTVDIDSVTRIGEVQLNSAPAGMIQAMLLSIRPIVNTGAVNAELDYNYKEFTEQGQLAWRPAHYFSTQLEELRLQYSGQSIYDAHTKDQIEAFNKFIFGDDLITDIPGWAESRSVASETDAENIPESMGVRWVAPLHIIPLMHDGDSVLRGRHFENLPHYSGSTLSLRFKVAAQPVVKSTPWLNEAAPAGEKIASNPDHEHSLAASQITFPGAAAATADISPASPGLVTSRVELKVTYMVASLLQSTNGVVELQL